jgi:outer membrane protein assembly factor BamB
VRKAKVRSERLLAMDAAVRDGSAAGVYAARDLLVGEYPELAGDKALVDVMRRANQLIRRAVTVDTTRRPAATEPQADPLGPPTSLVLRAAPAETTKRATGAAGPVVFALADGLAHGLDGATGAPLWQVPVGLSSPFPPQAVPGESAVLAYDARYDELVRLDARSGALAWRQALGEPVSSPPLMLGNQVIQAMPGGKVHLIDLALGELRTTFNLNMPLGPTPVSDEAGQFLYAVADKDCLFVLTRDPPGCAAVEYLGHRAGSVVAAPARLGRFLIVPENHTVGDSRWRVLVLDEEGLQVKPVQEVEVPGWTWSTPASSGSVSWAVGDRGSADAYAIGGYEEKSPLRLIARTNPEPSPSGPAFALAPTERELWVASGRSQRLELDIEQGKLSPGWTLGEAGPCLAPPQLAGDLLVLTQQSGQEPGVTLWGVEPKSGAVRWRTVLGADWMVAPAADAGSDGLATLALGGQPLTIAADRLQSGGYVELPLPKPGASRLPPGPYRLLKSEAGVSVLMTGGQADSLLVRTGSDAFKRVELPAPIAAAPLFWGEELLVPGAGGRVDLIDPRTGEARAEPYLSAFDREHPTRWRAPVRLDDDAVAVADESGVVRRLTRRPGVVPGLVASNEVNLGGKLAADPIATASAVILVTADNRIRALAARDLSPAGAWPLEAPLAGPPQAVAGRGFLADTAGNVHAFGPDGQRLWSIALRAGLAVGAPAVAGDSVWFLTRDGAVERHALADGAPLDRIDLDILPAGDVHAVAGNLVVPAGLGTLRLLKGASPP